MKSFLLVTNNQNKLVEFQKLFESNKEFIGDYQLFSLKDIGYTDEIIEDGTTFEENALIKARVGANMGYISFADDSGLMVDALNGEPGIYSARYSGKGNEENNLLLLKNLKGVSNRKAQFVSAIACCFPDGRSFTVRGVCEGTILEELKGTGGFGYDPLFYVEEYKQTFAELPLEVKNQISHRGRATTLFLSELLKELQH